MSEKERDREIEEARERAEQNISTRDINRQARKVVIELEDDCLVREKTSSYSTCRCLLKEDSVLERLLRKPVHAKTIGNWKML